MVSSTIKCSVHISMEGRLGEIWSTYLFSFNGIDLPSLPFLNEYIGYMYFNLVIDFK